MALLRRFSLALSVVLTSTAPLQTAHAQDDTKAQAKALANRAFDLFRSDSYARAAELFVEADRAAHSPVFLLFAAEALEKLGRLVETEDLLVRIVEEQLPPGAPKAFRDARAKAQARLDDVEPRIPRLVVRIQGVGDALLDGQLLDEDELDVPRKVDPGRHDLRIAGDDGSAREIDLAEGARREVDLYPSEPDAAPTPDEAGDGADGLAVAGAIAMGVGGAGLIIGAVAGGLFLDREGSLTESCEGDGDGDPTTCPDGSEIDDVKLLGNVATAGWVIAGVGLVAGTVLLVVGGDDEPTETTVRLEIAPTGAWLRGRF